MTEPVFEALKGGTLVHKWVTEVNTSTTEVPEWTRVRVVTDFKMAVTGTMQDTSDFDSPGWKGELKVQRAWQIELKVQRKATLDGTYDAGQEYLRAAGFESGTDAQVDVRVCEVHNGPRTEAYQGVASVTWSPDGGGVEAVESVSITLAGDGELQEIVHPYLPAVPPA